MPGRLFAESFPRLLGANPLQGPLESVSPENLDIFGTKWHSLRSMPFQGPKKSQFSGPNVSQILSLVAQLAIPTFAGLSL